MGTSKLSIASTIRLKQPWWLQETAAFLIDYSILLHREEKPFAAMLWCIEYRGKLLHGEQRVNSRTWLLV